MMKGETIIDFTLSIIESGIKNDYSNRKIKKELLKLKKYLYTMVADFRALSELDYIIYNYSIIFKLYKRYGRERLYNVLIDEVNNLFYNDEIISPGFLIESDGCGVNFKQYDKVLFNQGEVDDDVFEEAFEIDIPNEQKKDIITYESCGTSTKIKVITKDSCETISRRGC